MKSAKKLKVNLFKWRYKHISEVQFIYLLSILIGFLAGLGTVALKNITHFVQSLINSDLFHNYSLAFYFLIPIEGLIIVYLIQKYILKKKVSHAIPSVLYALSKRNGILEKSKMYASLITAPITVGFGGSVGLQGPAINTGAAIASNLSKYFHTNQKTRVLMIACATSGAVAAMFKAPIAAIVFALELFSLELAVVSIIPLLLASVSGVITSYFFLGTDILLRFQLQDKFEVNDILFYIALGVGSGIASVYFSKIYFSIANLFERLKNPIHRLIIGAFLIGLMLYFIPPLYGEGFSLINNLLNGNVLGAIGDVPFAEEYLDNIWIIVLLLVGITIFKAIAMTVTFAAGGVGGIIIPTLVMGSALGNVFAKVVNNLGMNFNISESNFTLIGMTGLMAGVLHTPLTPIFLIAEITGGYELFVPLMIVSAISFAITRYYVSNSIYTMELAKRGELITHNKDKNVLMQMQLSKIVERNFIALTPEMNLHEMLTSAVAKSSRNIFPVVDEDNQFLGITLLDDIRNIMFDQSMYDKIYVAELMHNAPDIIEYEKDSMETVMKKFKTSGAWNLPVVKDGQYHGFISKSKLLTAYRQKIIEDTL